MSEGRSGADYPSRTADRFIVRMPAGMRPWIAEEAKRNMRSANAQIVWMLQKAREQIEDTTKTGLEGAGTPTKP